MEQAQRARASRLVALGRLELDRHPSAAIAYARASLEIADNMEARLLALEALWHGPPARVLPGESGALMRAAFHPGGRRLALAGFGPAVLVISDDGRTLHRLEGQPAVADLRGVVYDPSGDRLLTFVSRDPVTRVFDSAGRPLGTLPLDALWIRFEKGGRLVAFRGASEGPQARALNVIERGASEPRALARWKPEWPVGPDQVGTRVPTSVDASLRWLAYGRDRSVFLHLLADASSRRDQVLGTHGATIREVAFHPDGERLFAADEGGEVREWSTASRTLLRSVKGPPLHRFGLLRFDARGSRLAWASGEDGATCIWDLQRPPTAAVLCLTRGGLTEAGEAVFHPDGIWLAANAYAGVAFWPVGLPDSRIVFVHKDGPVKDLAFSPDSRVLASAARDGLHLVPLAADGGAPRRVDLGLGHYVYGVAWSPSGRELAISAPPLGVFTMPARGGTPRRILDDPSLKVALGRVAFDDTGRRVVVVTHYAPDPREQRLYVIDLDSGAVRSLPLASEASGGGFAGQARAVAFTDEGQVLTAGDNGLRRWDLDSGTAETVEGGPGTFATFAIGGTRRRLIVTVGSAFDDFLTISQSEVRVLDLDTGERRTIRTHGDRLTLAIATDPAGELVVTGDAAGVVRVGTVSGEEPHLLLGHSGPIDRVAVSPDRRWIASASGTQVRLWPTPDVTKPPFHRLPHIEILARLRALTNVEVVTDPGSVTGFKVAVGPFPGWKDVPAW